ncbi:metal ABC transporter permease [Thermodesulfitimonas sp.]
MDIWGYGFFLRAMAAGVLCGFACPLVGVFLVARRYSFLADALAHIALTGAALGLILSVSPHVVTLVVVVVAAFTVEWLRQRQRFHADAVLAMVMAGGLSLGVILISKSRGFGADLTGYLFGSLLTISPADLRVITLLVALTATVVFLFYRHLFVIAIDEEYARAAGLKVTFVNTAFIVVAALTVGVAIRAVGVLLTGALVVIPVLIAMQVNKSFSGTVATAIAAGTGMVLGGLHVAYFLDLPPGPAVVLLGIALLAGIITGQQLCKIVNKS